MTKQREFSDQEVQALKDEIQDAAGIDYLNSLVRDAERLVSIAERTMKPEDIAAAKRACDHLTTVRKLAWDTYVRTMSRIYADLGVDPPEDLKTSVESVH